MCVWAGMMTSSCGPRSRNIYARCKAAVHEDVATACGALVNSAKAASKCRTCGPWVSVGPDRTSITASRSSSPIIGRPNGMERASVVFDALDVGPTSTLCATVPAAGVVNA